MIIWSGWGILVLVFAAVGFFLGIPLGGAISADSNVAAGLSFVLAGLATGLGSFLLARKIEGGEGRAFIDEKTQQRVVVKPHAGSLFFIPTRYWAYIGPIVGIGFAALMYFGEPSDPVAPDAAPATVEIPAAPTA